MNIPVETDKAWMAGFVDGEGCLTISRQIRKGRPSPAYRVMLSVSNTDSNVLEIFTRFYGGGLYNIHERRGDKAGKKWADAFDWYCPVGSAVRFLTDILPYLRLKQEQARVCLEFLTERAPESRERRPNGRWGGSASLTTEELARREAWRIRVQLLNSKGIRARQALETPHE